MLTLRPQPIPPGTILRAFADGARVLRCSIGLSLTVGAAFAVPAVLMLASLQWLRLAPLTIPLAGGILLLGPVALAGLLGVSHAVRAGKAPTARHLLRAWRDAPAGLWALTLFCVLMFLIWMTDAGTLYSFMIGQRIGGLGAVLPQGAHELRFHLSASLMGGGLASIVFIVTVHSVPLLLRHRTGLVGAVVASARAVFAAPLTHLLWGSALTLVVAGSLALPPLCAITLPWLAYSGHALHTAIFPDADALE